MSNGKISSRQKEILDYIKDQIILKGYPPSVRDICEAVHLRSTSSVHAHLSTLEKNGYIRRDPTKPRAIEIADDSFYMARRELIQVPLVGTVAAGQPLLAAEVFMLRVKGDSMINAGILNHDRVLVEKTETIRNGDKVVALIEDSATVKTFYREADCIRLQPENDSMDPIIVRENLMILGKVIGVLRLYQ